MHTTRVKRDTAVVSTCTSLLRIVPPVLPGSLLQRGYLRGLQGWDRSSEIGGHEHTNPRKQPQAPVSNTADAPLPITRIMAGATDATIACGRTEGAMLPRRRYGIRAHCKIAGLQHARARTHKPTWPHTHNNRPPDTSCLATIQAHFCGPSACSRGTHLSSHVTTSSAPPNVSLLSNLLVIR